jgi:hypothetical protein
MSIEDVLTVPPEELSPAQLVVQLGLLELAYEEAQAAYIAEPSHDAELVRASTGAAFAAARTYWRGIRACFAGVADMDPIEEEG